MQMATAFLREQIQIPTNGAIGRVSLASEKRGWDSWGQEVHILHVNLSDFVLLLVVIIELFPNSLFQLYCPKDYYEQKQWNTLPVTMITEIMNFN